MAEPAKLVATKWSGPLNVADPVACSVDDQGRVFVTETTRRKVGDLDIREHADWIVADNLPVRLQMQLHKYLWNDEPGR